MWVGICFLCITSNASNLQNDVTNYMCNFQVCISRVMCISLLLYTYILCTPASAFTVGLRSAAPQILVRFDNAFELISLLSTSGQVWFNENLFLWLCMMGLYCHQEGGVHTYRTTPLIFPSNCLYMCIYMYVCVCVRGYVWICMHVWIFVYMHIYAYIYIYIYMHI